MWHVLGIVHSMMTIVKRGDHIPEGITDAISFSASTTVEPFEGDHGIRFALRLGDDEKVERLGRWGEPGLMETVSTSPFAGWRSSSQLKDCHVQKTSSRGKNGLLAVPAAWLVPLVDQ